MLCCCLWFLSVAFNSKIWKPSIADESGSWVWFWRRGKSCGWVSNWDTSWEMIIRTCSINSVSILDHTLPTSAIHSKMKTVRLTTFKIPDVQACPGVPWLWQRFRENSSTPQTHVCIYTSWFQGGSGDLCLEDIMASSRGYPLSPLPWEVDEPGPLQPLS